MTIPTCVVLFHRNFCRGISAAFLFIRVGTQHSHVWPHVHSFAQCRLNKPNKFAFTIDAVIYTYCVSAQNWLLYWCCAHGFHVFRCAVHVYHLRSHIWILGSCVFALSLRCYRAHGELKPVPNRHIVNTKISRTPICWEGVPILQATFLIYYTILLQISQELIKRPTWRSDKTQLVQMLTCLFGVKQLSNPKDDFPSIAPSHLVPRMRRLV